MLRCCWGSILLEVEIQSNRPRHHLGVCSTPSVCDHTRLLWSRRAHVAVEAIFAARGGRVCRDCHLHLPSTFFSLADGKRQPCLCCDAERQERYRVAVVPPLEPPAHKRCSRCKVLKDAVDFRRLKTSSDGLQSQCRDCTAFAAKESRAATAAVPTPAAALPPTRWCSGCSTIKPRGAFHREISHPDGLCAECRVCVSVRDKSYAQRKAASKAPLARTVASPPPVVR